jgi:predicted DNA-binding transcriptional regulator AlpA
MSQVSQTQREFSQTRANRSTGKALAGERLLTPKEAADFLRVSLSWLAKTRMRGDGPPFARLGRSIRYPEAALVQWTRGRQRLSTSEITSSVRAPASPRVERGCAERSGSLSASAARSPGASSAGPTTSFSQVLAGRGRTMIHYFAPIYTARNQVEPRLGTNMHEYQRNLYYALSQIDPGSTCGHPHPSPSPRNSSQ